MSVPCILSSSLSSTSTMKLDCRACMSTSLSVTIVALSFLAACGNVQSEAFMVYMAAIKEQFRLRQVDGQ